MQIADHSLFVQDPVSKRKKCSLLAGRTKTSAHKDILTFFLHYGLIPKDKNTESDLEIKNFMPFETMRNIWIGTNCNVIVSINDHSEKESVKSECSLTERAFRYCCSLICTEQRHENNTSTKENESSHNRKKLLIQQILKSYILQHKIFFRFPCTCLMRRSKNWFWSLFIGGQLVLE